MEHEFELRRIRYKLVTEHNCERAFLYWFEIANAAMNGHALSKKKIEELLEHPMNNMGDAYDIISVTRDLMKISTLDMGILTSMPNDSCNVSRIVEPYLANRIREHRERNGMSRKELAIKAEVPEELVLDIEYMPVNMLHDTLTFQRIAKALGATQEELTTLEA